MNNPQLIEWLLTSQINQGKRLNVTPFGRIQYRQAVNDQRLIMVKLYQRRTCTGFQLKAWGLWLAAFF